MRGWSSLRCAVVREDIRASVSEVQEVLGGVQDVHDFINIDARLEKMWGIVRCISRGWEQEWAWKVPARHVCHHQVRQSGMGQSRQDVKKCIDTSHGHCWPRHKAIPSIVNNISYDYLTVVLETSYLLPLWDPSPVEIGAVGYLCKPQGNFVTLFNAFTPEKLEANHIGIQSLPSIHWHRYGPAQPET
jgi:hypothetical protein